MRFDRAQSSRLEALRRICIAFERQRYLRYSLRRVCRCRERSGERSGERRGKRESGGQQHERPSECATQANRQDITHLRQQPIEYLAGDPIKELREGLHDDARRNLIALENEKRTREQARHTPRPNLSSYSPVRSFSISSSHSIPYAPISPTTEQSHSTDIPRSTRSTRLLTPTPRQLLNESITTPLAFKTNIFETR